MNELLLQGLSELGLDVSRAETLERFSSLLLPPVVASGGMTLDEIYELFPSGPGKGACKMAGLPKPTGCV